MESKGAAVENMAMEEVLELEEDADDTEGEDRPPLLLEPSFVLDFILSLSFLPALLLTEFDDCFSCLFFLWWLRLDLDLIFLLDGSSLESVLRAFFPSEESLCPCLFDKIVFASHEFDP